MCACANIIFDDEIDNTPDKDASSQWIHENEMPTIEKHFHDKICHWHQLLSFPNYNTVEKQKWQMKNKSVIEVWEKERDKEKITAAQPSFAWFEAKR